MNRLSEALKEQGEKIKKNTSRVRIAIMGKDGLPSARAAAQLDWWKQFRSSKRGKRQMSGTRDSWL